MLQQTKIIKGIKGKKTMRKLIKLLFPMALLHRLDTEKHSINQFIKFASGQVKKTDIILDAGAGAHPYKKYFSHAKYESTDFKNDKKHTLICSLDKIPKKENSYSAIINTQVLEHVEFPQKVINEFYRILKPEGKLFLTAPQG